MSTTPDQFAHVIAKLVVEQVTKEVVKDVKAALRDQPAKMYDVVRNTPTGPVKEQLTLTQAMQNMTDELRQNSYITHNMSVTMVELIKELKKQRRLARELQEDEDDE